MTTRNLRILAIVCLISLFCYGNANRLRKLGDLGLAMELIEHQYVDEADSSSLYQAAMGGMLNSLDMYSGYIPPNALKPFQTILEQEFGGLGVSIDSPPRRDRLTVVSTLYDSPAFRAGVKPGDVILEVNGIATAHMKFSEASEHLRGREGSIAVLKLEREGEAEPITVQVKRARIEIESVLGDRRLENGQWDFHLQGAPDIGYFHVELFGEKTTSELIKGLKSNPHWEGIILDLRDNSGGFLHSAVELCDLFLNSGEIVSTKGRGGIVDDTYTAKPGTEISDEIPIIVIVNEQSASASEIVAACLQDHGRAIVVGTRTFGKGSVQNMIPIEGGKAAMRLTTAYYYPPKGRLIHRRKDASPEEEWGVLPSSGFEVPLDENGITKVHERFRKRADPLHPMPSSGEDETNPLLQKDPTLIDDPQLLRAIEAILVNQA